MSKERFSYEEFNDSYCIRDNERDVFLNVVLVTNMLNDNHKRIAELEEQLKNAIVLPCIKKHITYLDVDSELVKVDWYVIYKQKDYDEIFTIKCSNEEDANQELKILKGE